jgi:5'-3' exonuclease
MQAVSIPNIAETIALVDFSNMLRRNFELLAKDGRLEEVDQTSLNQLSEIRSMCSTVVVCLDSPPYDRKQIYPEYKAHREKKPEYQLIADRVRERLKKDGYQMARAQGQEADDVIATLAREYTDEGCGDVRIFGNDKDSYQLLSDTVRVFVHQGRGEYEMRDAAWVKKRFDVEPKDMALFQAICGDKTDGIPGIAGIGEKGAAKLINTYKTPAAMAVGCTTEVEKATSANKPVPAFWRNYAAGIPSLPKWIQLTTLNERVDLEKHPLKYLEALPVQPLVEEGDLGVEHDEIDWDFIENETAERERAELAASLPVDPPKPEPRIGKDPNADAVLQRAAEERAFVQKNNAPKVDVPSPNGSAHSPTPAPQQANAPATATQTPPDVDRNGVERPKAPAASSADSSGPPAAADAGSQAAGADPKAGADATQPSPAGTGNGAAAPSTHQTVAAPSAESAAHVVPTTQGPQKTQPRKRDEIHEPETGIVRVAPPSWALAAQPSTAREMLSIAGTLYNSRLYSQFGNERGVFAIMALGRELGMGFSEALEAFHNVKDRPCPKAKWLLSRMQKHPDCEWIIITHADEKSATIKSKHRHFDEVLSLTYTIERAIASGFTTGPNRYNWEHIPRNMLRARVISEAYGDWYPGAAFAFTSAEDMADRVD